MTRGAPAREAGFTVVELLVSMTVMLGVLFATLSAFDAFNSGVARNNRLTAAEDGARRTVARVVGILRGAGAPAPVSGAQPATVIRAHGNDLVVRSTTWPGESAVGITGTHVVRLCVDGAGRTLWLDGLRAGVAGPTDPGAACPSTATGWSHQPLETGVVNDAAEPLFQLGSGSPVRTVGVALRLEGGTVARSRPLALVSGVALRGALAPQVAAGDVTVGPCESGKALLTLDLDAGGASTDGAKLTAANAITVGPGQILVDASTSPVDVALTVTNVLGLQTLLFKQVSCP